MAERNRELADFLRRARSQVDPQLGRRTDGLATNRLGRALLADFDAMPARDRNYARWMFRTSQAHDLLASWTLTGSQTRPN